MHGYQLRLVSYVGQRDGMAMELADEDGEQVAEVFEDSETKARSVTVWSDSPIPLDAVDWLLSEARSKL